MFTYQVRQRFFKLAQGHPALVVPNDFEAVFFLQPLQPFGKSSRDGRTAVQGVRASAYFNANTGHHFVESATPLQPLDVVVESPIDRLQVQGNEFKVFGRVESLQHLSDFLHGIYFALPVLLNVEFGDPPVIERVEGKFGTVPFRWELNYWAMKFQITNQEEQERKAAASWARLNMIAQAGNRRLFAALHYFHVFCRLCRAGHAPWEFMAEGIMNLCKILEVLFPPFGEGTSNDSAREGLRDVGYSNEDIERFFVPAIVLRNSIDSAHVDLSLFTTTQLRVLHAYTEAAEREFKKLLSKILTEIEAGRYVITQHEAAGRDARTDNIINNSLNTLVPLPSPPLG